MNAKKNSRIKIGVKYCGGCNPIYDRVASVEFLEEALTDEAQLVSYQDGDADYIIVVTGCGTACVNVDHFEEQNYYLLSNENDFKTVIDQLSEKPKNIQ